MRINFVSEVKNGEIIELFSSDRENSTIIIGKTEEKTCFEYVFFTVSIFIIIIYYKHVIM